MKTTRVCTFILATAVAIAALSGVARAVPVVYTIDASASFVTTTGFLFSPAAPFVPQFVAPFPSSTAFVGGMLVGDLTAGTLTFSGGNTIDALPWPGAPFLPAPDGPEPDEDNVGLFADTTGVIGVPTLLAIRDLMFDIPAGSITDGAVPAGMTLALLPGSHVDTSSLGVDISLAGVSPNTTLGLASIMTVGLTETVTIPLLTTTTSTGLTTTTGVIVASRMVPEPPTVVLAGLGMVGMALAAWRKRKPV